VDGAERNLVDDQRCTEEQARYLTDQMASAFPEAVVIGYERLIEGMTNDAADRHVLAAAIAAGADVIVTDNVRHFPSTACEPYGIEVQTADEFLSYSFDLAPEVMGDIFLQQVRDLERPALDAASAVTSLQRSLPSLAARLTALARVRAAIEYEQGD
jgi:hypothetical protein